jgi:hypothetical protein
MAPLGDGLHKVSLDSAKLAINIVTIEGRQLEFHTSDDKLYVALDRDYPVGVPFDLVIQYHAQPKRGLFFVMPDGNHPNRPQQIWAQGDTAGGNNRFWFPGYDSERQGDNGNAGNRAFRMGNSFKRQPLERHGESERWHENISLAAG